LNRDILLNITYYKNFFRGGCASMATNHPDRPKRQEALEQWFKSMNQLMQEKPAKGILQRIYCDSRIARS
jgi:hypothetical protein